MRRSRTLRSATFRLSLAAVPLYLLAGWALLAFVYVNTMAIMDHRVDVALTAERTRLLAALADDPAQRIRARIEAERGSSRLYRLITRSAVVANFDQPPWLPPSGQFDTVMVRRDGAAEPTQARLLAVALGPDSTLVLGRDLTEEVQFRKVIEETLGFAVVLTALLALAAGVASAKVVLRRLAGFNVTAQRILHGTLSERMPETGNGDEFDALAVNLNEALDRINELMAATRQVTDNVAHDLRSPLSRIRNRLELALVSGGEAEEVMAASVADIDQVLETFEALLSIARLEHGLPPDFAALGLVPLVEDLVDYFQPLAEEKDLSLTLTVNAAPEVEADRHLLFQALSNVLDNAVRYTPAGGTIAVEVGQSGRWAQVRVADSGPGIPVEQRANVLKRFVRLDSSRHQPGNGLGLAVVEAVVRHHHGLLDIADNHPGAVLSIRLPAVAG